MTVVLTMRFDMRVPDWAGPAAAHYSAALDMCEWAETRGAAERLAPLVSQFCIGLGRCAHDLPRKVIARTG